MCRATWKGKGQQLLGRGKAACMLMFDLPSPPPFSFSLCSAASASVFLNELEASPGFTNPCSSDNLKAVLGVAGYDSETKPSLINSVQMYSDSPEVYTV